MTTNNMYRYKRNTVIATLIRDRDNHINRYLIDVAAFNIDYNKKIKEICEEYTRTGYTTPTKIVEKDFGLKRPRLYSEEYDKKIAVYEAMLDDVIELNIWEAQQIFNNDWPFNKD